jgi:cytochrome c oxidase subunit IV
MKSWQPPRELLWSWLGLLGLLGLTVTAAYQPLGAFNTALALTIASAKGLIVAASWSRAAATH